MRAKALSTWDLPQQHRLRVEGSFAWHVSPFIEHHRRDAESVLGREKSQILQSSHKQTPLRGRWLRGAPNPCTLAPPPPARPGSASGHVQKGRKQPGLSHLVLQSKRKGATASAAALHQHQPAPLLPCLLQPCALPGGNSCFQVCL